MTVIFLTGFMGAGKTSVGEALAQYLNCEVIDTDHWVEHEQGKSVQRIFADEGESAFRNYESEALKRASQKGQIITTGGGIVTREENRMWMRNHGFVVYLHCHPEECFRRLATDTERPLLAGKNQTDITDMMEKRVPFYEKADLTIDTSSQSVSEVAEEIVRQLTNNESNGPY